MSDATIHSLRNVNQPSQTDLTAPVKHARPQPTTPSKLFQGNGPSTIKADQAKLSVASGLVTKALAIPDVRADKVANVQKAIAAGTYSVPSSAVAGKLVQSLLGD